MRYYHATQHVLTIPLSKSLSAQVILRGTRSAGYGFVALSSAEAAQKAVEQLHQKELDGRTVIVEIAKPADQKEAKKEKKPKRKQNRRGSKSVPGEVTEAEANGAVVPVEGGATPAADEGDKPKKAKKSKVCCKNCFMFKTVAHDATLAQAQEEGCYHRR